MWFFVQPWRGEVNYWLLVDAFTIITREAGAGGISLGIEGPSKAVIDYQDKHDGTSDVNYTVTQPGLHPIIIIIIIILRWRLKEPTLTLTLTLHRHSARSTRSALCIRVQSRNLTMPVFSFSCGVFRFLYEIVDRLSWSFGTPAWRTFYELILQTFRLLVVVFFTVVCRSLVYPSDVVAIPRCMT